MNETVYERQASKIWNKTGLPPIVVSAYCVNIEVYVGKN